MAMQCSKKLNWFEKKKNFSNQKTIKETTNKMIREMNHILNFGEDIKSSDAMILAVLNTILAIDHFTVTWPTNGSEAAGDPFLIQTSVLL